MTFYICQCPHRRPASVWTAESEDEIILAIEGNRDVSFDTAEEALEDDMRASYITTDPLDLYLWIVSNEAPAATRARGAFLTNRSIQLDVEALATAHDTETDTLAVAFDGRFIWSDNDEEWRLGNQEPVAADDLFEALCEASVAIALQTRLERSDA